MNKEKFIEYLKNPAQLYELNYQELKSLVVEYPYCQNLRFLLAKKSQLNQSNEFERDLRNAASCVPSRTYLFQSLNDTKPLPRRASHVIATENSLEIDHLSAPSKSSGPDHTILGEDTDDSPTQENIPDTEANSPAEAKGDNALPSESPPEVKKNEQGNKSSELRISSEKIHLAEKPIVSSNEMNDSSPKNISSLEDLTPIKKVIHQKIIKKAPPIKSDLAEQKSKEHKIIDSNIPDQIIIQETESEFIKTSLPPSIKSVELPETETEIIDLKDDISERGIVEINEEIEEVTLPPLFPIEPAPSTINNIVIVEPKEEELEEIFPPSFDDHHGEVDHLKSNIPFEITNEDDFIEEVELDPLPSPRSTFNSWIKEFKSDKSKKKKKKSQKKEPKTNNQVEEITAKKKKKKKKNRVAKNKKWISKIIKSKKKAEQEDDLPLEIILKAPKKEKKPKTKHKENEKEKAILPEGKKEKSIKTKKKKKEKKKKKKNGTKSFALKSIVENEEIASETLAEILVEQGSIRKAINMYERLSLIFPEKSTFFAKRIEKLKNI